MIKRISLLTLMIVMITTFFSGCEKAESETDADTKTPTSYEDFIGTNKKFGIQMGDVFDMVAKDTFMATDDEIVQFGSMSDLFAALDIGKVDAALISDVYGKQLQFNGLYPNFNYYQVPYEVYTLGAGAIFNNAELRDKWNDWFETIKADGTWQRLCEFWIDNPLPKPEDIPQYEFTGENGTLVMADTGNYAPLAYITDGGQIAGLDVDMASLFAQSLGMKLEIKTMDYDAIFPYIESGKAAMSACSLVITQERQASIPMGEPFVVSGIHLVTNGGSNTPKADGNSGENAVQPTELSIDSFKGKRFGIEIGTGFEEYAEEIFEAEEVLIYDGIGGFQAVESGIVDCTITDLTCTIPFLAQEHFSSLDYFTIPKEYCFDQYCAISDKPEYVELFNAFLKDIRADGTLDDMVTRWVDNYDVDNLPTMPEIPTSGENGVLKVATSSICPPFVVLNSDGEFIGFEVELMTRFAASLDKTVEFTDMSYEGLLLYVKSGKCDISAAMYYYRDERAESVYFTDSYYDALTAVIYRKSDFEGNTAPLNWEDYIGKKFGVMVGSVYDTVADDIFKTSEKLYFETLADEIEAARKDKVDAVLLDEIVWMVTSATEECADLQAVSVPLDELVYEYGAFSHDSEWVEKYNIWLEQVKADGTYDEMVKRWLTDFSYDTVVTEIETTGENGTLRVGIYPYAPFTFIGKESRWHGFDIEQFTRFAASLGMNVEFHDMTFAALLPYVASGKADFGSSAYITAERAKQVVFTTASVNSGTVIMSKKDTVVAVAEEKQSFNFFAWLKKGIQTNLITENRWKMIVDGLGVTLQISFLSQIFGTILGACCAYLLSRKARIPQYIARFYSGLIHGTPMVVLLMISYYIVFGKSEISSIVIAVAAFTLVEGAMIGGKLQTAISTVDPVEIEAARSMGYSAMRAFFRVTLPQAIKVALPGYLNGFVELVKATAIVGYIAIQDLSRAGDIIRSRTYDAYFPLLFVALIYLVITTLCVQVFKLIIRRLSK